MVGENAVDFLDRHGSLSLLLAIFLQTCAVIWWASSINTRMQAFEVQQAKQELILDKLEQTITANADRLTRVQTVQESVVKLLDKFSTEHELIMRRLDSQTLRKGD